MTSCYKTLLTIGQQHSYYRCHGINSLRPNDDIWHHQTWVNIVSGNDLSSLWCQAIKWTNADLLSIISLGNKFQWKPNKDTIIFIQESTFENAVCRKMSAIFFRPQLAKQLPRKFASIIVVNFFFSLWKTLSEWLQRYSYTFISSAELDHGIPSCPIN